MSGSAFHQGIAQDAVDLMQVRRTVGRLAGRMAGWGACVRLAGMSFSHNILSALTSASFGAS